MAFTPITHLRHVDLAVPDYAEQCAFYATHWGLVGTTDGSGLTYFAAEGSPEQYVVRVRRADSKRLDLIAFGVADRAAVDSLASKFVEARVRIVVEPGALQTPGGGYGFRCFDPNGLTIEISSDVESRPYRELEPREAIPARLSHVVVNSPTPEATRAWYEQHLGFRVSDTLNHPAIGDLFYFMRCNRQHHVFAIARGPHTALNHASFEMRGIDEYMFATGRMLRAGARKVWGPGRHRAGDNTFSYFMDPNGNVMELTTELEIVDESTWTPRVYSVLESATSDQWGTASDMSESIAGDFFNSPDSGRFVAPPV